jgi:hypothetical protein
VQLLPWPRAILALQRLKEGEQASGVQLKWNGVLCQSASVVWPKRCAMALLARGRC